MSPVYASAPGKIILFGEHAVVYGQPAIAVPVTKVKVEVEIQPEPQTPPGTVRIIACEVSLDAFLRDLPADHPSAAVLNRLGESLGIAQFPACTIKVHSTLPVAAGLGSGAAVSVAILRAMSAFLGNPLPEAQISALAYEVDKIHHGTPSGIDNTVITYGKPVYFTKGEPIETFDIRKPFTIVVGDTGIPTSTAETVGDVRKAWATDPGRYEKLFQAVGDLVRKARQSIEADDTEQLGPLMDQNHALLCEMGVSGPELNRLVEIAREAGAGGAKLSGGGRGGNMIALVEAADAEAVAAALRAAGAVRTIVTEICNPELHLPITLRR
jgi:mevalonate kinase